MAVKAWQRVDQLARDEGRAANYRAVLNDPRAVHAIGALGGWQAICSTINEWQMRTFISTYVKVAGSAEIERAVLDGPTIPQGAIADARNKMLQRLSVPRAIEHRADSTQRSAEPQEAKP